MNCGTTGESRVIIKLNSDINAEGTNNKPHNFYSATQLYKLQ